MPVARDYEHDVELILGKRHDNGADFWTTPDGRWGVGSPFSTFDCALMLHEIGMPRSHPILKGAAERIFALAAADGRIRPAPKGAVYPCHTANAARVLCRLGYARDRRLAGTYEHLFEIQHVDGGWRCNTVRLGKSDVTDASNPGVTLYALDAFRFTKHAGSDKRLDRAVRTLLDHWRTREPLGPCAFGIGSRFMQVEYPFLRYNLFSYVYVLSFYESARKSKAFKEALAVLGGKTEKGRLIVENPNRGIARLAFCRKGETSRAATRRYREIIRNVEG